MRENAFSERAMLIFSLALLILAAVLFSFLWFGGEKPSPDSFKSSQNLAPVDVNGLDSQAKTLLGGLKNNSGIPISEPTTKEGREDPFAAL